MKIQITTEDFRNATCYTDSTNCPLATAVKRQVEADWVSCSLGGVTVRNDKQEKTYSVTWDWCSGQQLYKGEYWGMSIDDMIHLSKNNPDVEFPTIELELTLI